MKKYTANRVFRVGSKQFKKGDAVTGVYLQSILNNKPEFVDETGKDK